jgi:ribosomal protein S12 methylthiotransferase
MSKSQYVQSAIVLFCVMMFDKGDGGMNQKQTVAIISLGCAKNTVDSEMMCGALATAGYRISTNVAGADFVVINTCAFIDQAKEEAIDTIMATVAEKEAGNVGGIIVAGCLAQGYSRDLRAAVPEIDAIMGTGAVGQIVAVVEAVRRGERPICDGRTTGQPADLPRLRLGPPFSAYLKIAEGCDNRCHYCAIPNLRGPFRSRPRHELVVEAIRLANQGAVELNLIAQDITRYPDLIGLLDDLQQIETLRWIRLLYAHPDRVGPELLDYIARAPKICPYLDIPVQHADRSVLQAMGRSGEKDDLLALVERARAIIPNVVLRTTLLVGFPAEGVREFDNLLSFVRQARFDYLGVFTYSPQPGTPAWSLGDPVPAQVKEERRQIVMSLQAGISQERWKRWRNQEVDVLVETVWRHPEQGSRLRGRMAGQAPEVDGKVFARAKRPVGSGEMVQVTIENSSQFDIYGVVK